MLDCIWLLHTWMYAMAKRIWFLPWASWLYQKMGETGASTRISIMNSCLLSWVKQWTEDESKLFIDYKKIPWAWQAAPLINHLLGEQRLNTPEFTGCAVWSCASGNGSGSGKPWLRTFHWILCQTRLSQPFQQAAIGGFGAYLIDTDYESSRGKQCIWPENCFPWNKDLLWCYWTSPRNHPARRMNALRYTHQNVTQEFASLLVRRLNGR